MKRSFKKFLAVFILFAVLLVDVVPVNATTVTTSKIGSSVGYTLYVREARNNTLLGQLYMKHTSSQAFSSFTAAVTCTDVVTYASYKNSDYTASRSGKLQRGAIRTAVKNKSNITKHWGYCRVTY